MSPCFCLKLQSYCSDRPASSAVGLAAGLANVAVDAGVAAEAVQHSAAPEHSRRLAVQVAAWPHSHCSSMTGRTVVDNITDCHLTGTDSS